MAAITVIKGDITTVDTDVIVNAANESLLGGGGVDGAIHRAGGPEILEACKVIRRAQGGCPTGEAVITTAGRLKSRFVVHTVGPVWRGGAQGEATLLQNAYVNSLKVAVEHGASSIAFPNISTGVYGYPKSQAAAIAVKTVSDFLSSHPQITTVLFVCFDDENYRLYQTLLENQ